MASRPSLRTGRLERRLFEQGRCAGAGEGWGLHDYRARQRTSGAQSSEADHSEPLEKPQFVAFQKGAQNADQQNDGERGEEVKPEKSQTPEEQLANAHKVLRDALANDLLEAVMKSSPTFFEEL